MDLHPLLIPLGAAGAVVTISLAVVASIAITIRRYAEKHVDLLASFAAGVFTVIGLLLFWEIVTHSELQNLSLLSAGVGALAIITLARIPEFHHHHSQSEKHGHHSQSSVKRILISDGVHNIGDGVLIGTAFAVSAQLGIVTTVGVIAHESLQVLAEFFLLRQSQYSTAQALKINLLISLTIFGGVALSLFAVESVVAESILMGLATGTILAVVFHDLIPSSIATSREQRKLARYLGAFLGGAALMSLLNILLGH